jgi:serine/threonine protein kinase/Flp pilus assembly protein TadD
MAKTTYSTGWTHQGLTRVRERDIDQLRPPLPVGPRRKGFLRRLLAGRDAIDDRPALPRRLGRYRLLHRLGEGGMGVVFAAEDESLGRRVAVKTISEANGPARERFRREARAAAAVNHPNVCQVYEIGEDAGELFIAMELLEGESLSERLKRGPLPVEEALGLAKGMLAALQALHGAGTLHRDVKPSNTFLTPHGVKLLDFGLARPLPRELTDEIPTGSQLTRPGLMIGTPRYMAPEQILGDAVDARADLFALAAVLYEAIAGRPAFLGTSVVEVLSATLHDEPPALAGSGAVVALDRALRRALAKRSKDRPASSREMLAEIDAATASVVPGAMTVARPLTRLAVLPFRLLRPDPEIEFLPFALADAVSTSLSGLPSVVIRPSAAVARFATEAPDLKALAREADVDLVLVGTLLRAGDQLRATAQILEAPGGTLVSSHTLQSTLGDAFRLQDELSERIVESLSPCLGGREGARRRNAPASARAYEFYLRANDLLRDWSQAHVARDLYLQCLAEDPAFAPAWAKLGRSHRLIAKYHLEDPRENLARAEEAFQRALELDRHLPIAHKLLAHHEADRGRAPEAMVRLMGLARANRNDPETFAGLVHACRYAGLVEASEAAHREAQRLDPRMPTSVMFTWWAKSDLEAVLGGPAEGNDFELYVMALHMSARTREALDLLRAVDARRRPPILQGIARGLVALLEGRPDAMALLHDVLAVHEDPEALFMYGTCQAYAGDGGALASLAKAVETGYPVPAALRSNPWLSGLRGEGRLDELVERAEMRRREAARAFRDNGGEELLGALPA